MRIAWMAVVLTALGCSPEAMPSERIGSNSIVQPPVVQRVPAPLAQAHCEISVDGVGIVDMENDYLPWVVVCENGGANLEALKAQAIAARSVAYYAIETSGSICNGQGCQVYSCTHSTPQPIHYQAVEETSGLYLLYNSTLTYGFYVAGDNNVSPPDCVGHPSASTEGWVTYNEGKAGTDVQQTALGWIHNPDETGYGQNRGCMSQWGARCLENEIGYGYRDILRFFYGDDIIVTQAAGECVLELDDEDTGSDPGTGETGADGGQNDNGGTGDPGIDPTRADADTEADFETDGLGGLPAPFDGDGEIGCGCRAERAWVPSGWAWALLMLVGVRRHSRPTFGHA